MLPPSLQDSLPAGWLAFAGRASTLWIAAKVSGHPSSFSGLGLAQGKFHFEPPFTSFDHLVGKREQRRRNGKAEHSCGLGVEDQLELACPQDWKVSGLSASENTASIDAHLTIGLRQARAVTHQPTDFHIVAFGICRGDGVPRR